MQESQFNVEWIDRGIEPVYPADQSYPEGIDIDASAGRESCVTNLPYPAQRIGYYEVTCNRCGGKSRVTTAGRPDDPRSITVACMSGKMRE
jgi:hypothetical protein